MSSLFWSWGSNTPSPKKASVRVPVEIHSERWDSVDPRLLEPAFWTTTLTDDLPPYNRYQRFLHAMIRRFWRIPHLPEEVRALVNLILTKDDWRFMRLAKPVLGYFDIPK